MERDAKVAKDTNEVFHLDFHYLLYSYKDPVLSSVRELGLSGLQRLRDEDKYFCLEGFMPLEYSILETC